MVSKSLWMIVTGIFLLCSRVYLEFHQHFIPVIFLSNTWKPFMADVLIVRTVWIFCDLKRVGQILVLYQFVRSGWRCCTLGSTTVFPGSSQNPFDIQFISVLNQNQEKWRQWNQHLYFFLYIYAWCSFISKEIIEKMFSL